MAAPAGGAAAVLPLLVATTNLAPRPAVQYEWRLAGLTKELFTAAAAGHALESPPFTAHGLEWTLKMWTDGERSQDGMGHVSLYVRLLTQNVTAVPCVTLSVGVAPEFELQAGSVFSTCEPPPVGSFVAWGCGKLLSHNALLSAFDAHVPGGVLTMRCTLRVGGLHHSANPATFDVPPPSLSAAWGALLASGEDADVTLMCGDERVAAHRLVLCARSPVFAAQLREGPLRVDAAAVPVPSNITPHTLTRLMEFIYTDELEPASPEEATHLPNAADHYGVRRLFAICERTLCAALAVENAAETLTLADQHSAATLKDAALRFVAANAVAVMATPGWTHLLSSRPALIAEALHTLATGAPPEPPARLASAADAGGEAGAAGAGKEGTAPRPRKRAR
jgi:speckle-type POZ protein